jgi:hypothetical protein
MKSNKFNFIVPVSFEKSKDDGGIENYKFKAIASDDSEDSQGDQLIPSGFDVKEFISSGFINWNHSAKTNPKAIIGHPTKAEVKNNQFLVEGILYGDSQLAKDVVETAIMLEKSSGGKRSLYLSIEGIPLKRNVLNSKKIEKARITGLAICPVPVNKNTLFTLIKGEQSEDFVDYEYEFEKSQDANGGEIEYLVDIIDQEKGVRVTMNKDLTIKIEKCMTADSPSGKAIKKESLEPDLKNLSFKSQSDEFNKAVVTIAKGYKNGIVSEEMKNKVAEVIQNKK